MGWIEETDNSKPNSTFLRVKGFTKQKDLNIESNR